MKKNLVVSILAMVLSSAAMASSHKICFGSTKNEDTKGVVLTVEINNEEITIRTRQGDFYNGTYPAYKSIVKGRDGNIYLEYKGENVEYQDVILVDQLLLQNNSSGMIQIRARGEGFFNSVFECRDTNY